MYGIHLELVYFMRRGPEELKMMLKDYSKHRFNQDVQPTEEDIVFLFRLFDRKTKKKSPDGAIDRSELMSLLRAWGDFMKQKELAARHQKKQFKRR